MHTTDHTQATILLDSVFKDHRLTTFELTFPRCVLSEFNTHRVFSRNSASSRAIPVIKQIEKVFSDPYIPDLVGKNQPGMSAKVYLEGAELDEAQQTIKESSLQAIMSAMKLMMGCEKFNELQITELDQKTFDRVLPILKETIQSKEGLNVHKQTVNRYLEPYLWHTVLVSSTDYDNFIALRDDPNADPAIAKLAKEMKDALKLSHPQPLQAGEWHIPFITDLDDSFSLEDKQLISIGRNCRVSYETHHGTRDPQDDIRLAHALIKDAHMSPCEHVAQATDDKDTWANFQGFSQYRRTVPFENNYMLKKNVMSNQK